MNARLTALIATAGLFGAIAHNPATAAVVTLDFGSLPSAQGWVYGNNPNTPAAENSVFSVSGGQLHQNTVGTALVAPGGNGYNYFGIVDPVLPYVLEIRARLVQEEQHGCCPTNHYGFFFGIYTGFETISMGLGITRFNMQDIYPADQPYPSLFDVTQFHDYRITGVPGVGYDLYIDDVFIRHGLPSGSSLSSRLLLGDGTGAVNAEAFVSYYLFAQNPVPLPAALPLFATGLGILGLIGWRRKRKGAITRISHTIFAPSSGSAE